MNSSVFSAPGDGGIGRSALFAVALVVAAACLHTIHYLNSQRAAITQQETAERNLSASALYVELATLAQPSTTSSITRAAHRFVRQDTRISGITLVDKDERLIAHLGNGNDTLLDRPASGPTARIPIKSDGQRYGHAIVVFDTTTGTMEAALHYFTLTAVSVMLVIVSIALLRLPARTIVSLVRQVPTAATLKKQN